MMEMVVTVGAIRRSSSQIVTCNKPTFNFLQARSLPVTQPSVSEH